MVTIDQYSHKKKKKKSTELKQKIEAEETLVQFKLEIYQYIHLLYSFYHVQRLIKIPLMFSVDGNIHIYIYILVCRHYESQYSILLKNVKKYLLPYAPELQSLFIKYSWLTYCRVTLIFMLNASLVTRAKKDTSVDVHQQMDR